MSNRIVVLATTPIGFWKINFGAMFDESKVISSIRLRDSNSYKVKAWISCFVTSTPFIAEVEATL